MTRRFVVLALTALLALPIVAATKKGGPKKLAKPQHISKGETVAITDYVVPGKTTIFDFYSDFCPPCVRVAPSLEKLHQLSDDVVVVKVDINRPGQKGIDWKSPVAQQYKLQSIPHFKVYGPDGKLIAGDEARDIVMGMIEKSGS